jgi:hypothetical protein
MPKQTRKMPTERQIRTYWADKLGLTTENYKEFSPHTEKQWKFDSPTEAMEPGICFACGMASKGLERAHITARCNGGSDTVENLHMLCHCCHKDSEVVEGEAYWEWFWSRTMEDVCISAMLKTGKNVWQLFNSKNRP